MPEKRIRKTFATQVFSLDEKAPEEWGEQALPAMARHQFAAQLRFDLMNLALPPDASQARNEALSAAAAEHVESFEELLFHGEPPVALLRLAKDFFKQKTKEYPERSADWQVAYLFYVLSIVAAGNTRISTLTSGELFKGTKWALERSWVDAKTKKVLRQAVERLQASIIWERKAGR